MGTETTEQKTTQKLEEVINDIPSTEKEEVSEEEPKGELEESEVEEPESKEEPEKEFESRVQAGVDKVTNTYREKREADTALIRKLQSEVIDLRKQTREKTADKLISGILSEDEEEGRSADETKSRETALKEFSKKYNEYSEKSVEVEEVANLASELSKGINKDIAKHFDLFDDNSTIRAKGVISLISDAIFFVNREKAFNKILEEIPLLQNGSEVRQQIDGFINGYLELSDEKGKDLLIKQIKQEFKVTPRKKPTIPSDGLGGKDWSKATAEEKVEEGRRRDSLKK